ncbi:MAG: hypothetical protein GPJ54_00245 [Candidatus Heimdallarchaeota archaeon]|nr:hypothetical protein [Candidatus Heimdallarchaeota archaeon]
MGRKSNTPKIFRDTFNEIITMLSKAITKVEMHAAVPLIKEKLEELRIRIKSSNFEIEDVMISSNLTKRPEYYKTWVQNLQVVAQLVNAGRSLDEFRSGVRLDYVKVEKAVKVVVPEGLALPKGQIKNSKVVPADQVKVVDVDTGALMKTFVSVFSQLLEPLKIEV